MFNLNELMVLLECVNDSIEKEYSLIQKGLTSYRLEDLHSTRSRIKKQISEYAFNNMKDEFFAVWESSKLEAVKWLKNISGMSLMECKRLLEENFGR
jgi:hypothetical protein